MTLQNRIQEAMKRHPGLSQADIARACKVKTPSITGWLNGDTKTLKAETARLAGLLFRCDPHWLATGAGVPGWHEPGQHVAREAPGQRDDAARYRMLCELFAWLPRLPLPELSLIYSAVKNAAESVPAPMHALPQDRPAQPAAHRTRPQG